MMSDFTESEFNLAMAEMEGVKVEFDDILENFQFNDILKTPDQDFNIMSAWEPYSDLNQLMPIAWKHKIEGFEANGEWVYGVPNNPNSSDYDLHSVSKDPVEAIRQCLWQIYLEGK